MKRTKRFLAIAILCILCIAAVHSSQITVRPITNIKPYFLYNGFPESSFEQAYGNTGKKIKLVENSDFSETVQQKYRRYFNVPSLVDLGVIAQSKYVNLVLFMDLQTDIYKYFTKTQWSNIPFLGNDINAVVEMNGPRTGFLELMLDNIYASFGRRQIKWGPGSYDFAINDSAPFLDSLYLKTDFPTQSGNFWFNYIVTGFNGTSLAYPQDHDSDETVSDLYQKTLFSHRFGWETDSFRIAISELNLIYDKTPSLLDATPLTFWHNNYQHDRSNVMFQLSAEKLFQFDEIGFRLFGEFAMDDLELGTESSAKPTSMGFALGAQVHILDGEPMQDSVTVKSDFVLREDTFEFKGGLNISYEWYWATAFLYNRDKDSGKFTVPAWMYSYGNGGYIVDHNAYFIGFPYGPDTMVHKVGISYEQNPFKIDLDFEVILKGAYSIENAYGTVEQSAPYSTFKLNGPVKTSFVTTADAAYTIIKGIQAKSEIEVYCDLYNSKTAASVSVGMAIDPWAIGK
ncbi:MAG: hypothetical protein PHT39_09565 [Sphaerochaetaceae bacterium]|nr:hypothetical protein [Candidatus Cloacimonadota bacterium]MDD2232579.1 hypothetical protein [Sphaerochaetaceae bacterium]MDD4397807.1 hypothetical protein [Sphaerochaetaceae bacterium]